MKNFLQLLLIIGILLLNVPIALASGYFVYHYDAEAQGKAGAFVAEADNPSAVYYNPAGISQLDGTQIRLGSQFIMLDTDYKNLQGVKENMDKEWSVAPDLYITTDFGSEKFTGGIGIYAPFGLATSWSGNGLFKYIATDTSFSMVNVNPTIAYQVLPELSIALGADYYNAYSYLSKLKQNFVIGDADVKLDVDGDGWGFNLGCMWKPHEKHSFGLTYRSRVDIELDGDFKYKNIPAGLGYPSSIVYTVTQDMRLPSIVSAGYAFKPTEKLKLELDAYWVEWSTIDEARINDKDTDALIAVTDADWKDTWVIALGGEYYINSKWTVRGGYCYQQNAIPEKTFNPAVPDSDIHVIALGLGYQYKKIVIDIAYAAGFFSKRDINNTVGASVGSNVNGKYDTLAHVIGASVGYKF